MSTQTPLPLIGRPPKPSVNDQIPYDVGAKVIAVCAVPAAELESVKVYVIAERLERPMFPAGPVRWFYRLEGYKRLNVYHDFIRLAKGTCRLTK